jgi:hypothetical protein
LFIPSSFCLLSSVNAFLTLSVFLYLILFHFVLLMYTVACIQSSYTVVASLNLVPQSSVFSSVCLCSLLLRCNSSVLYVFFILCFFQRFSCPHFSVCFLVISLIFSFFGYLSYPFPPLSVNYTQFNCLSHVSLF